MAITIRQRGVNGAGWGGKLAATLFFGLFAAVGTLFFFVLGGMAWSTVTVATWEETSCLIEESFVPAEGASAAWQVRYRYVVAGVEYVSTEVSRGGFGRDSSADLRDSQRYVAGEPATCFVNSNHPEEAVLRRASIWFALWGFFPLPFMAIGYGGIFFTWRPGRPEASGAPPAFTASARRRSGVGGTVFALLFFGAFFAFGAFLTWVIGVKPVLRILAAEDWAEIPCTVLASSVEEHDGDDSTTYSVRIVYRYEFDGRTFTSDRYKFLSGSSSGRSGKQAIVREFPAGSERTCYVNPQDPTEAVIERGLTADLAFGFIPLVFALVGAGGLIGLVVRRARGSSPPGFQGDQRQFQRSAIGISAVSTPGADVTGPVVLEAKGSRTGKFVAFVIFSLFWNGIISIFVVNLISEWSRGGGDWFMLIFLLPFIAIGLLTAGAAVHSGLALFNPRPRLRVSSAALAPGGTLDVQWEMIGDARRVQRFQIVFEGREEATYRRGTNTHTDKSVFTRLDVADIRDPAGIVAGAARLRLPEETMHSFESKNNKIVWILHVRGDIPRWPDIDDEFPFTVLAEGPNPFLAS